MITQHYEITPPIPLADGRQADGILVNDEGAWLGEVVRRIGQHDVVTPYSDEAGNFLPPPDYLDWFALAVQLA